MFQKSASEAETKGYDDNKINYQYVKTIYIEGVEDEIDD